MQIPKIIHQLWKNDTIPPRWRDAVAAVKRLHEGWEYRLWTDAEIEAHVRTAHPDFYPVYAGFNRNIMRLDTFRYILMQDFGGLYCDLDYEFLRPFDYRDAEVMLSYEFQKAYGDTSDRVANYVFASRAGHPLWPDILAALAADPPRSTSPDDVPELTGPGLMTRVYFANPERYSGVMLTDKPVLSPRRVHGRYEQKFYINSGITYGFHHGWGTWRQRLKLSYFKKKLRRYAAYIRRPHL